MADIKIYGVSQSTFTRTVRLTCHEKGIDWILSSHRGNGRSDGSTESPKVPLLRRDRSLFHLG